ncbi:glycosyltransferase [Reichenbachiella agarivorans]|uniref:Glycosyltransferase n=1 Tax=Reichenbachiella agarivorans TaxID=2979464 RepID=A0ABY6CRJ8_9BACT|nr:glycosyltransferase [Reichenbachiella agarivorans]UXP30915.1 glycosyltransferase [Reichenbachiella agarivorans]
MFCLVDCNNFWSPSGGGVRRYHLEKMEYFKGRPDIKYVFVMHDEETYTEQIGENAYIEHLRVPKVMGNWEYRYLRKRSLLAPILKRINPDVIEVGSPYFMPSMVNKIVEEEQLKAKVFGFWHADFPVTYVKRFLSNWPFDLAQKGENKAWAFARKHYNKMAGVLASSEVIIQRMQKNGLNNVHFVPLGVNEVLFHPNKKDQNLIDEMKAGVSDRLFLFFPHRFSNEKGLNLLLEAYPLACAQLDHDPVLVLAGTGPYQPAVEKAAKQYPHVHFIGFIKEKEMMAKYFACADLGFALSAWETFGLSLVEALSSGLPLIAANDGAAMEHIQRSEAGLIIDSLTPEVLANAIVKYALMTNKDELKAKARAYGQNLSWENCFSKQVEIYQQALS